MVVAKEKCKVCGKVSEFKINDDAVLLREAVCEHCGASIRNSDVAEEIIRFISGDDAGLMDQGQEIGKYEILNTCSTGYIHNVLKDFDNYTCSEYFDNVPSGDYCEGILCVDLCHMPFEDNTFDIVVSEDVFEHVEHYGQALKEIFRVLKPGGCHIFTVPLHDGRMTESRENKRKVYHGDPNPIGGGDGSLVITDWGDDIDKILEGYGYQVEIKRKHVFYAPEEITDVDKTFDEYLSKRDCLEKYQKYNSIVIVAKKDENICTCTTEELIDSEELREKIAECNKKIREYNREIRKKNEIIRSLNDDNEKRGLHIIKLNKEIEQKDRMIQEQREDLDNKESELVKYNGRIAEQDKCIAEQQECISGQNERISGQNELISRQNERISEQDKYISEQGRRIMEQNEHILKQDKEIAGLQEYQVMAQRELNSRAYKFGFKIRKAIAFILPQGSKRRVFVKMILKAIRHPKLMIRICRPSRVVRAIKVLRTEGIEGARERYHRAEEAEKALLYPCDSTEIQISDDPGKPSIEEYPDLQFKKPETPLVSIIIPVYNQFDYTYKCLESILKNSGDVSYEVIIADDNSNDFTVQIEKRVHNVVVVRNEKNLRFLRNCNHAARYARGSYILFLNNDTQVQENWLQPLLDLIVKDPLTGMVGSKLVYADGWLQEAGGIVWEDASAWNYGNRKNPGDPEYNYVKEADFISGACIMIKKKLWDSIGGFDEEFAPAYYEDVDLAFEVRKKGYKVLYQPLSVVVHFEGVSNGTDISSGQKSYQVANKEKFYKKWKDVLEKENFPNGENVFLAKDRGRFKKHILVVDHYVPHFDKDAGGRGTFMYLKLFKSMGMHITFIGDNFFKHEPYTTMLNQEGIEILYGAYYLKNYQKWIKENGKFIDYVYLQRPHISVKYMDLVKECTNAKIIYYDVDLCHVREMRQYEITKDESLLESAEKWKEIEFGLIEKADVVHVVGSYEEEYLKGYFPDKKIRNIPLYIYSDIKQGVEKDFDKRKDLLFVGGFGHPPNEDAVLWFAQNVFPKILKEYPDIKWYIVGAKPPESVQGLADEHIIVKGFVSDEELDDLYSRCRLDVVPLRYGAGVKGKVLEAIYNQIPLVTTSVGAEGLSKEEDAYWMVDDAETMAELIINIYSNKDELLVKSENCKKFILNHFTIKKAIDILHMDMNE